MRIDNPARWCIDRLQAGRSFYTLRYNDGEMLCMYRLREEGSAMGTVVTPATTRYTWGDDLRRVLKEVAGSPRRQDILLGASWNTDRADAACVPFGEEVTRLGLADATWTHEHWPLEGVVDGSTIALLDAVRATYRAYLVTCDLLQKARHCLRALSVLCPRKDSWQARRRVLAECRLLAEPGAIFVWACGPLKSVSWDVWQAAPWTSHLDVGHLFNGALGLKDYGWLQRGDGPWHEPYFRRFTPYVRRFIPRQLVP